MKIIHQTGTWQPRDAALFELARAVRLEVRVPLLEAGCSPPFPIPPATAPVV
ncbi:hypothetical protein GCM10011581_29630 [Saccharopolyspora subtropica]|uniref:Uncharacterized protein n=1 Tax=Saccharopolyspora thermophila TaxID=89367 RepID=A0A917JYF9_9PSEU|nr:hypothetical protein GCM10011581_29630 [Saccharopolyspora subtropica]